MGYNPRKKLIETRLPEAEFKEKICMILGGGKWYKKVVWTAGENEIVVELDAFELVVLPGRIIVQLMMDCDEFGRQPLVIPFNIGSTPEKSYLLAVVPDEFGGHQGLARTWGKVASEFVWQACLDAMQVKWQQDDGLADFRLQGFVGRQGLVQGLFAYPAEGGVRDGGDDSVVDVKDVKDMVDSLELAQIHLGLWKKGTLIPKAVGKKGGRVSEVEFQNGIVMDSGDVAALMKEKKVEVAGVTAVRKGSKLFLRAKPDKRIDNNLRKLPPIRK